MNILFWIHVTSAAVPILISLRITVYLSMQWTIKKYVFCQLILIMLHWDISHLVHTWSGVNGLIRVMTLDHFLDTLSNNVVVNFPVWDLITIIWCMVCRLLSSELFSWHTTVISHSKSSASQACFIHLIPFLGAQWPRSISNWIQQLALQESISSTLLTSLLPILFIPSSHW